MDWSKVSAVAEVIGSIGVILYLIYLAKEVRSGAKNLRTSMRDSTFHSLMEWNYFIMSDPDSAWVFQQGCENIESLEKKERARYVHVMFSFFKMFENIYLHYSDKSIDSSVWEHNRKIFESYAVTKGAQHYWNKRKAIFDPQFQIYFDKIQVSEVVPGQHV